MNEQPTQKPKSESGPKVAQKWPTAAEITWDGRKIPMALDGGKWRARKRSKLHPVDIRVPTADLAMAKRMIKEELERRKNQPRVAKAAGSLRALCDAYLAAPKRASDAVASDNVERLTAIVRLAWGKKLEAAQIAGLSALWPAYVAARQGLKIPDYNTRRAVNAGINSAMRMARSLLIPSLHPAYAAAGIVIPADAASVMWLPELHSPRPDASDQSLIAAWQALPLASPMWRVVGLARFSGLRRSEILAMLGKWAVPRGDGIVIELRDRPEDRYWSKTGRPYSALVLSPALAGALRAVAPDSMILTAPDADRWIERVPQTWLKPYVGAARLPLHRLRGLYADHVRRETEDAILARQAAIKVASQNLGHTSTAVTEKSYLSA